MPDKKFSIRCPNCVEPDTEIKYRGHVAVIATVTKYGGSARTAFRCTVCGAVEEIRTGQMSFIDFDDFIKTKNSEDDKNASR